MEFKKCYEGEYHNEKNLKPDIYYIKHNWTPCNSIKHKIGAKRWLFIYNDGKIKNFFNVSWFHAKRLVNMIGLIPVKKTNIQGEYYEYRTKDEHKNELARTLKKIQKGN